MRLQNLDLEYIVYSLKLNKFKDLLFSVTKQMYFIFNNMIYKHIDGASMKSPLGSSLAKAFSLAKVFLTYRKQNWINRGPLKYRPLHY